jgi:hypothetical protein
MTTASNLKFAHTFNDYGGYASICMDCLETVALVDIECNLGCFEQLHQCGNDPAQQLIHFGYDMNHVPARFVAPRKRSAPTSGWLQ